MSVEQSAPHRSHGRPVPPDCSPYWQFYDEVALQQMTAWLPQSPALVLDLAGAPALLPAVLAGGHRVVSVRRAGEGPLEAGPRVPQVRADVRDLAFLRSQSVDVVIAPSGALSSCLASEVTVRQVHDVLRPGGRLLLVVDSLVLGLARLADQGRWAELADVSHADVVLVPDESGQITRCFRSDELVDVLVDGGLEVDWIRPRSVITPATVERAVEQGGRAALRTLVKTELTLAAEHQGEQGLHLVASARRPR